MIRLGLFYVCTLYLRVIRLLFRASITGDTNYLATPLFTIKRILTHACVHPSGPFVDIGCGEGLVGVCVRLIQRMPVILHDTQSHFLVWIRRFARVLWIPRIHCEGPVRASYANTSTFFCCWTSWSVQNRRDMVATLSRVVPAGAHLITVSHGMKHPEWIEVAHITESFAWGRASVYYYKHA